MFTMRGLRIAAWAVATATFLFLSLGVVGVGDVMGWIPLWWARALVSAVFLAPAVVGLLIANRQPRNRIAWILLLGAFLLTLQLPIGVVQGEGWTLQMDRALWPLLYAWPIAVTYVFPNGRFLSPRWRWVALAGALCFAGFMAQALFDPTPFEGEDASVANPIAGNAVEAYDLDVEALQPIVDRVGPTKSQVITD